MGLLGLFRRKKKGGSTATLTSVWTPQGIQISFVSPLAEASPEALLDAVHGAPAEDALLGAYLAQLAIEGLCQIQADTVLLPWKQVYDLLKSPEHEGAIQFLALPPQRALRPILSHEASLSDSNFELHIDGWVEDQDPVMFSQLQGAVALVDGESCLLSEAAWTISDAVRLFGLRGPEMRSQHENELAWGRIRAMAEAVDAFYASPYLESTYVLTPQTLRLPLIKEETSFGRVFTVSPTFEDAPEGWLRAFDGFNAVQPHYDLTRGGRGRIRIVISEPVQKVLQVIKRDMPGRRVSGSRAEKFIHNPWAFLGDAAHEVLREEDFMQDKAEAGAVAAIFTLVPRMSNERIEHVDLVVTESFGNGSSCTDVKSFERAMQLEEFLKMLETALREDRERFPWNEYDLTIDAESTLQLEQGMQLAFLWRNQPAGHISFEDIYQLEGYSNRIEGIGVAKPIYVPILQKPNVGDESKQGWLPGDLTPMVRVMLQGHEGQVIIPLSKIWVDEFESQIVRAERAGVSEVRNEALPTLISTIQGRNLVDTFRTMLGVQDRVKGDGSSKPKNKRLSRETLLVKTNFHGVDYQEERRVSLALPEGTKAQLPVSLRTNIGLKKHQLNGVAWFQHLVSKAPHDCRGALLADDMGLGKTLQLLTLLGWYYEQHCNATPSIIFAPKSLLENWANEAKKFFTPSFPEILVLYADELRERKQPPGLIDEQLHSKGVVDLLRPRWVGDAKIIVSTYEVLISYEFSLAKQPFAFVICDEAQRIKTPGTQVTLAAKKLKADFRIACTGTPVENSLADLWCLFDFVQPGLLGALEEFGKTYRRPIECETEEQKQALARLQSLIAPQTLRRTKADIADELKKKLFGWKTAHTNVLRFKEGLGQHERLEIAISEYQRILYKGGLKKLQEANKEIDGKKRARLSFGALHLMKAVCAEPYCLPGTKFLPEKLGRDVHLTNSPKLQWVLEQLEQVKAAGEKAIIFTELREAQAALYYFLRETFSLKPFIINGDSQGRQGYIDRFSQAPGFGVIILSTLAAGAGLNVTAANHVFHFTRAWNPAKENQASDRAYRIGQERDVFVYCPTVVADDFHTFEFRLDELLKKKAGLADSTIDGGGMASMLNGSGRDATFSDFIDESGDGAAIPRRILNIDDVDRMDGFSFEVFCNLLWSKQGYQSFITPKQGGDGGIDVVALKGREGELLQCKSSINSEVGWDAIKEVTAGAALYQARFAGTRFRKIALTNQRFTSGAITQAEANKVQLIVRDRLDELLKAHPITNHEFDEELIVWSH
ncbi:Helicase conserved C-terminal domain-containing protein [Nitrosospira multiformis]|uniref:Helicase conserved C-terminal domain-containing protein n=1 Tax=Nitrosospira multiformis TaxID=1231 RepID=A0A1H9YDT1_9PROT|nr:SNF2-related protein [Nitrosospira multiformis]SES67014.1 Helicase conserved C-terminal domain-containing protein [Nitrosospira multiformis]